jgi:ABC-type amino acid transport substrate-binding protein
MQDIDGVVADITITKDRWEKAEFTQPYVQSSLRMLVPLRSGTAKVGFWIFLAPFSTRLWVVIVSLYVSTALCLFYMELKDHDRHP